MHSYKQLYLHLFNALTDALEELDRGRIIPAIHLLKAAQRQTESWHMELDIIPEEWEV